MPEVCGVLKIQLQIFTGTTITTTLTIKFDMHLYVDNLHGTFTDILNDKLSHKSV